MLKKSHTPNGKQTTNATKEKIDRHLRDINDTISEDDINNIGTTPPPENPVIINNGIIEIPDDSTSEDVDNKEPEKDIPTTWNIVS
ncbi:MAG: hypothetical protein M3004_00280 [Bacteroidota bacterium]|nr:hypothetical protein [Bacteroidota bacterium]